MCLRRIVLRTMSAQFCAASSSALEFASPAMFSARFGYPAMLPCVSCRNLVFSWRTSVSRRRFSFPPFFFRFSPLFYRFCLFASRFAPSCCVVLFSLLPVFFFVLISFFSVFGFRGISIFSSGIRGPLERGRGMAGTGGPVKRPNFDNASFA